MLLLACLIATGCQPKKERFAQGNDDVLGPQLTPEMLITWRPSDPAAFVSPGLPANATPPVATPQRTVKAGALKVPVTWIPPGRARPWQYIVVHHSATNAGGAVAFDRMHRDVNGWDELGYHFVIGNGTDTPDGFVEVGSRWPKQKQGAHAKTADNRFNEVGVGICLVGDFEHQQPTHKQLQSLAVLTAYLMDTYRIPNSRVIGHRDTKATECPGYLLTAQLSLIRNVAARAVAQGVFHASNDPQLASDRQ